MAVKEKRISSPEKIFPLKFRSLRKQPSFFAPGPSGVSRAGSEEGRLFSQARSFVALAKILAGAKNRSH